MSDDTAARVVLDEENPWPALSPFDESAQRFFNGRRDESAELCRLVQQSTLTVLFGKSGLGKTSLLKAGLFPQLRAQNLIPVYVRLNVIERTGPLVNQLTDGLIAEVSAHSIDAPMPKPNEPLWTYLHRCGLEFWSAQNRLVTPVFVLDQFEEVFTLGAENRTAIGQLRADLADLIENRIPAPLAAESERSADREEADTLASELDVRRQPYKVLVSFREDYLPAIEGWKRDLPSLLRNRMRLLPMTGEQALAAVSETAPKIAPEGIAKEIVRFVAAVRSSEESPTATGQGAATDQGVPDGAAEDAVPLVDLLVEPALLSLVCHGLNERRKQQQKPSFDRDLLQDTGQQIIGDFYTRALEGMPDGVHRFIETELITERGFRKPSAIDDAKTEYEITDDQLRTLVNRRLLRVEPHQGIDRLELIHDVLTPVVRQRREQRRQIQRQAEAKQKEATQVQRRRQRLLLVGFAILFAVSAGVSGLAYWAFTQRDLAREESIRAAVQQQRAEEEGRTSQARELAARGTARSVVEPALAAAFALRSLSIEPTAQAEALLRQALPQTADAVFPLQSKTSAVAYSPDGGRLAIASQDGRLTVLDAVSGQLLHEVRDVGSQLTAVRFSFDGTRVFAAAAQKDTAGKIVVWDWRKGDQIERTLNAPAEKKADPSSDRKHSKPLSLGVDDVGRWLAAGWSNGEVSLWDARDFSLERVLDTKLSKYGPAMKWPPEAVRAVAFGMSGKQLMAARTDGQIVAWDLSSAATRPTAFTVDSKPDGESNDRLRLNSLALSPDGAHAVLAFGGGGEEERSGKTSGISRIVDAGTGEVFETLRGGHSGAVLQAVFSADGSSVITSATDGTICVWNAEGGWLRRTLRGHSGEIPALAASPSGGLVASGGEDRTVRVWSVSTLPFKALSGHEGQVTSVAFSPDGEWLASGGFDRTVRVWDASSGKEIGKLGEHSTDVVSVAISPDGKLIASAGGSMVAGEGDTSIRLWDRATMEPVRSIDNNQTSVMSVAFSPDGRTLATTGFGPPVRLWKIETGQSEELTWPRPTPSPHANQREGSDIGALWVAFGPDGTLVAAAGVDGVAGIWDARNRVWLRGLRGGGRMMTSSVFDDSGTRLLTVSLFDPEIIVWNVLEGTVARRFKGYGGSNAADLSGDSILALTADVASPPRLWDVGSGTMLTTFGQVSGVWVAVFGPESKAIATAGGDGLIHLWDCWVCAPLPELRQIAERRLENALTPEQLQSVDEQ